MRLLTVMAAVLCWAGAARADVAKIKAEPNLEKRSKAALDNAADALKQAREAYSQGNVKRTAELAKEVEDSVQVCADSLKSTGKNPRKSPKWFKRAEMQTHDLLRRIEAFHREMSFSDRPILEPARLKTQQVQEEMLLGVVEGKK